MILAIDTATEAFSVAIKLSNKQIVEHYQLAPRLHSKLILSTIKSLLKQHKLNKSDLSAIVFGKGPGSFTGVRIAVSVAQGLSAGLSIPIVGVSTLASMAQYAYRTTQHSHISCAIDARMQQVYWAEYQIIKGKAQLINNEQVVSPEQVHLSSNNDYYGVGSGWISYQETLKNSLAEHNISNVIELFPHAYDMINLAEESLANNKNCTIDNAMPTYLRNNVAKTIKEREQLIKQKTP